MVLGNLVQGARSSFAYGTITLSGLRFHGVRLEDGFVTPRPDCTRIRPGPATPVAQRAQALTCSRFRLIPFRSPLLGESRLLSLPGGTKMFQFSPFAPPGLCVHPGGDPALPGPGFPIGASPGLSLFAATRSLSQLTTPFIASPCQGIPHVPLVALPAADSGLRQAEYLRVGAQNVQGRSLGLLLIGCQRTRLPSPPKGGLDSSIVSYHSYPSMSSKSGRPQSPANPGSAYPSAYEGTMDAKPRLTTCR